MDSNPPTGRGNNGFADSSFCWLDVIVSAITLLVFIFTDGRERKVPNLWLPILGTFLVGVSFGMPFYLYFREVAKEHSTSH